MTDELARLTNDQMLRLLALDYCEDDFDEFNDTRDFLGWVDYVYRYLRDGSVPSYDDPAAPTETSEPEQAEPVTADLDPAMPSGPHGDEATVADAVSAELDRPEATADVQDDAFQTFAVFKDHLVSPYVAVPTFTSPGPMTRTDDEAGS